MEELNDVICRRCIMLSAVQSEFQGVGKECGPSGGSSSAPLDSRSWLGSG